MSQRRLIDTNVILRHLVQDHPRHARLASRLFEASDRGDLSLLILPAVLAECVFVLDSFYQHARSNISEALASLISSPGIEIDNLPVHLDALHRYGHSKLHYVDCTIAAYAAANHVPVATFDAGIKKMSDVTIKID